MTAQELEAYFDAQQAQIPSTITYIGKTDGSAEEMHGSLVTIRLTPGKPFDDEFNAAFIALSHPPNTPLALLLGLHELGHLATGHIRRDGGLRLYDKRPMLKREASAWRW